MLKMVLDMNMVIFKIFFNVEPPLVRGYQQKMRPLAYYVARAATTSNYGNTAKESQAIKIVKNLDPNLFGPALVTLLSEPNTFFEVIKKGLSEALKKSVKYFWSKTVRGGDPYRKGEDISLINAVRPYKKLVARMLKKYKRSDVVAMIKASFGNYLYWVQHAQEKVVIFGHTHHPMLYQAKKVKGLKGITTYCNSGSWVTLNSPTWVDIHFRVTKKGTLTPKTLQLRQYNDGSIETSTVLAQMPFKSKKKKKQLLQQKHQLLVLKLPVTQHHR